MDNIWIARDEDFLYGFISGNPRKLKMRSLDALAGFFATLT